MALYVYMRVADSAIDWTDPDVATAYITNVSIQFNNNASLMSELSAYDLYCCTVRNGFNGTFAEYQGLQLMGCGSFLKIVPGIDFPLTGLLCPGSLGNYQIQIIVRYKQISTTQKPMQINIVAVSEGSMVIDKGNVYLSLGFLTEDAVAKAPIDLERNYIYDHSVLGGSFWSKLKDFAQGAWNIGKKAVGAARSVLDSGVLNRLPIPPQYKAILSTAEDASR